MDKDLEKDSSGDFRWEGVQHQQQFYLDSGLTMTHVSTGNNHYYLILVFYR